MLDEIGLEFSEQNERESESDEIDSEVLDEVVL